jgi:glycosyltransferase involved in cell wall biosynthesis
LVTYAGTLGKVNGVGYLVDIAADMLKSDPSVRFFIAGLGQEWECVRERARAAGVWERNLWMSRALPKRQMPGLLSASTVSVSTVIDVPELWNNSANKFFEALAAGRPMLVNHQGWLAELIQKTGAGLVVPSGDPAAAAGLLRGFLADKERMARARDAAAHLADHDFNRERLFSQLVGILESAGRA